MVRINDLESKNNELSAKLESYQASLNDSFVQDLDSIENLNDRINDLKRAVDTYAKARAYQRQVPFTIPKENMTNDANINDNPTSIQPGGEEIINNLNDDVTPMGNTQPQSDTRPDVEPASTPQPTPTPVPQPDNIAKAGDIIVVKVSSKDVSDMYGYQFEVKYDKSLIEYKGSLKSSIPEITTIFAKNMDSHILIGATKIGTQPGYSGEDANICEMSFVALQDCDLSQISINSVNIVKSDLSYIEGIDNWSYEARVEK